MARGKSNAQCHLLQYNIYSREKSKKFYTSKWCWHSREGDFASWFSCIAIIMLCLAFDSHRFYIYTMLLAPLVLVLMFFLFDGWFSIAHDFSIRHEIFASNSATLSCVITSMQDTNVSESKAIVENVSPRNQFQWPNRAALIWHVHLNICTWMKPMWKWNAEEHTPRVVVNIKSKWHKKGHLST